MIRAIIVDDEEKSRLLLQNLLSKFCSNIEVCGLASSVEEALYLIKNVSPDLIFLDIVMPDQNGFELLKTIGGTGMEVIITTAYDQFAIKAIRFSAMDYLLKPIDIDELQTAVHRVQQMLAYRANNNGNNQKLDVFLENNHKQPHQMKLGLPTQSGINFVSIDEIMVCKAEGNYSLIYMQKSKQKEMVTRTLKEFEELLAEFNFFRIHRSYLINLNHIKEYCRTNQSEYYDGDGGCVIMSNDMRIPVSRDRRKSLLSHLSKPF